jgi:dienelactone hydrolase
MDWGFFPLIAESLAERGIAAVAFNCSGSGVREDLADIADDEAFAKDTCSRQLEDIARVREYIARELSAMCDPSRAGVFGHSRGGGMALIHAAEHPDTRAVVTWAALPTFDRFDAATKALWRKQGYIWIANARLGRDHRLDIDALLDAERNTARLDIEAACARVRAPALLVHGGIDDVIEPEALQRLREALRSEQVETHLIEIANHAFGATHPLHARPRELEEAREVTLAWFQQHLS